MVRMKRFFASDNCSLAHPRVLSDLAALEADHVHSYGDDTVSTAARKTIADLFCPGSVPDVHGRKALVNFVFTGTAANLLCLSSVLRPGDGIIACVSAHINTDEGAAAEMLGGYKILACEGKDGKLLPSDIDRAMLDRGNVHKAQPALVSISQTTELGTLYGIEEIRQICDRAHHWGLPVHLDGSRLAVAVDALLWESGKTGLVAAREILTRMVAGTGVDLLTLGGTKNGLLGAEATVHFVPAGVPVSALDHAMVSAGNRVPFLQKAMMQLGSKMRYLACQMDTLYRDSLWLDNARAANTAARHLGTMLAGLKGVEITRPCRANAVFARLPLHLIARLQDFAYFYVWDDISGEVRLMCGWDSTLKDADELVAELGRLLRE